MARKECTGYIGVLIDFDQAKRNDDTSIGSGRTATPAFMAVALLQNLWRSVMLQHLYRYDLESFLWVFHWMCFKHQPVTHIDDDSNLRMTLFNDWIQMSQHSYDSKFTWMAEQPFNTSIKPTQLHAEHWEHLGKPWTAAHRSLFWKDMNPVSDEGAEGGSAAELEKLITAIEAARQPEARGRPDLKIRAVRGWDWERQECMQLQAKW